MARETIVLSTRSRSSVELIARLATMPRSGGRGKSLRAAGWTLGATQAIQHTPDAQRTSQPPQLLGSAARSTQSPQSARPGGQDLLRPRTLGPGEGVEVDVQIQRAAEPLDRGDAPGPRIDRSAPAPETALPGEDGPGEEVEQASGEGGVAGRDEAHSPGHGEHPLSDGHRRQDVADQVVGGVLHPPGVAGGTEVPLAGTGGRSLGRWLLGGPPWYPGAMPFATAVDGVRLYYEEAGAGPPLLLVPGQAQDRTLWSGARDDFAARHRVIVFDHRGTGDSDKPEVPYSTRGFARDAIAVLDALGIHRAHAYGVSMGGRICQWLGIDHAARIGALVLGCTTPGNAHGVRRRPEVDEVLLSGDPQRVLPYLVSLAWAAENWEFLVALDSVARARLVPPFARKRHYDASESHDAWDLLPTIAAPTLVVHGDADEVNVPKNAALLAARIPGAKLEVIPGARHAYYWECRPAASELVMEFLARHPLD